MAGRRRTPNKVLLAFLYVGSLVLAPMGAALLYFTLGLAIRFPGINSAFDWIWIAGLLPMIIIGMLMTCAPIVVYFLERSDRR